jgi:hypothetical protein
MYLVEDKSNIDFLYHGTNYQSAMWVAKSNKLKSRFTNHISFTADFNFFKKKPAIVGSIFILWKLDYKKLIEDGYKFIVNTSKRKDTETGEIISKDKVVSNFKKYVLETYIYKKDLIDTYSRFSKKIENFEKEKANYVKGTTILDVAQQLYKFPVKKVPENYEEFASLVLDLLPYRDIQFI